MYAFLLLLSNISVLSDLIFAIYVIVIVIFLFYFIFILVLYFNIICLSHITNFMSM